MLTQEDYTLWTSSPVTFDDEDWAKLTSVAGGRLASFLCLDALPEELPDDLGAVLAWFIKYCLAVDSDENKVASKHIRNFTITFNGDNGTNAFEKLAHEFGDVMDKYSDCGFGFAVERSTCRRCCGRL